MLLSEMLHSLHLEFKFGSRMVLGPEIKPISNSITCLLRFDSTSNDRCYDVLSYYDGTFEISISGSGDSSLLALEDLITQINAKDDGTLGIKSYRPIDLAFYPKLEIDQKYKDQFARLGQPNFDLADGVVQLDLGTRAPKETMRVTAIINGEVSITLHSNFLGLRKKCKLEESGDVFLLEGYVDVYVFLTDYSSMVENSITRELHIYILKKLRTYIESVDNTGRELSDITFKIEVL